MYFKNAKHCVLDFSFANHTSADDSCINCESQYWQEMPQSLSPACFHAELAAMTREKDACGLLLTEMQTVLSPDTSDWSCPDSTLVSRDKSPCLHLACTFSALLSLSVQVKGSRGRLPQGQSTELWKHFSYSTKMFLSHLHSHTFTLSHLHNVREVQPSPQIKQHFCVGVTHLHKDNASSLPRHTWNDQIFEIRHSGVVIGLPVNAATATCFVSSNNLKQWREAPEDAFTNQQKTATAGFRLNTFNTQSHSSFTFSEISLALDIWTPIRCC